MEKIRVCNNKHIAGVPYRLLSELDFVEYSEAFPADCARRLHEKRVDLALIPLYDYAVHGGYAMLDFGMGCRQRSGSMVLYALRHFSELKAIHVYASSRSSLVMLQILLKEVWGASPEIIRHSEHDLFQYLSFDEGILSMHDCPGTLKDELPFCTDLVTAWYEHTGLPAVLLVWALRPGQLNGEQLAAITHCLHTAAKYKSRLAFQYAESYGVDEAAAAEFVGDNRRFYFDEFLESGMDNLLRKGAAHQLHPPTILRPLRRTIFDSAPTATETGRSVDSILEGRRGGASLSIADALFLIKHAPLELLEQAVEEAPDRPGFPTTIRSARQFSLSDLNDYLLNSLGGSRLELSDLVSIEGLESLEFEPWHFLLQRLYQSGIRSWASFSMNPDKEWEDCFVYLERVRSLQHEMPVFAFFCMGEVGQDAEGGTPIPAVVRLVVQLFLHSIPCIEKLPECYRSSVSMRCDVIKEGAGITPMSVLS